MNETIAIKVTECVEARGFDVVDIEMPVTRGHMIYRVFIDNNPPAAPGFGVTADDCATVSRAVGAVLDELDPFSDPYTLEVSSPGLFRKMVTWNDWQRAIGKRIRVQRNGSKSVVGILTDVGVFCSVVHDGKQDVVVPTYGARANLQPKLDFGERNDDTR